jgi:hypothetical protein
MAVIPSGGIEPNIVILGSGLGDVKHLALETLPVDPAAIRLLQTKIYATCGDKSENRNPKSESNPKFKGRKLIQSRRLPFDFFLRISDLFRISTFEFRICGLAALGNKIKIGKFEEQIQSSHRCIRGFLLDPAAIHAGRTGFFWISC